MTPNIGFFAYFALAGVIVTSFAVLASRKPEDTCLALIMAAILFLPVRAEFKIPKVPALTRDTLPYLCLFVFYVIRRPRSLANARLWRGINLLVFASMVSAVVTAKLNSDPIKIVSYGPTKVLPGLDLNDGLAFVGQDLLLCGIPFLLGRMLMKGAHEAKRLLQVFAVGGLLYSFLILIEVRLSPQLHNWIYGYTPRMGDFSQTIRWGGFRPIVFMEHPLAVALFMCNAIFAAFVLARSRERFFGVSWLPFATYLLVILIAGCKSVASIVYALTGILLVMLVKPRRQARVAVLVGAVTLLYPVLRGNDLFPTSALLSVAGSTAGADRAQSLEFRLSNEDTLLVKARSRIWFGWGGYGRGNIYDVEYDGRDLTILDGYWISLLCSRGAIGSAALFLLLLWPVYLAARNFSKVRGREERILLGGLVLMVTVSTVDLIPNGLFLNYPFFLSGALYGFVRAVTAAPQASSSWTGDVHEDAQGAYELADDDRLGTVGT